MSPVKYELCSYIPVDDILLSHRREDAKSYGLHSIPCITSTRESHSSGFSFRTATTYYVISSAAK
jgi:hypothetical protein